MGFILISLSVSKLIITQKVYYIRERNYSLRIRNSPFIKQPYGRVLISAYFGVGIYLIFGFEWIFYRYITINVVPLFPLGIIVGSILHLVFENSKQKYMRFGDLYYLNFIENMIKNGCDCGSREFITGMEDTICIECGNVVFHWEQKPKKSYVITPDHLNPLYLFSKKKKNFEFSIRINSNIEKVYNYLISPPSKTKIKKYKYYDYNKISDTKEYWKMGGIKFSSTFLNTDKFNNVKSKIEYGTNYEIIEDNLTNKNGVTILTRKLDISYLCAEKIINRKLKKSLKFIKKEIEQNGKVV